MMQATEKWLEKWLSGGQEIIDIPDCVKFDLLYLSIRPKLPLKIYRSINKSDEIQGNTIRFDNISSWTSSKKIAESLFDEFVYTIVYPKNILFAQDCIKKLHLDVGGVPDQHEVILLPGTYVFFK